MRKLLILAFLLYDVITIATRSNNYDYDDDGSKRHSLIDDRRNWRKKALVKSPEDRGDWDRKRPYDYEGPKYGEDVDKSFNVIDRQHEIDASTGYRQHRYEGVDNLGAPQGMKSSELVHSASFLEKEPEKKSLSMSCERPHERYEPCFSGCAAVTCDNPRDRMQPCYPFCEAGCICVHPYVRDDRTHKCVLPEDCTKGLKGIPDLGEDT